MSRPRDHGYGAIPMSLEDMIDGLPSGDAWHDRVETPFLQSPVYEGGVRWTLAASAAPEPERRREEAIEKVARREPTEMDPCRVSGRTYWELLVRLLYPTARMYRPNMLGEAAQVLVEKLQGFLGESVVYLALGPKGIQDVVAAMGSPYRVSDGCTPSLAMLLAVLTGSWILYQGAWYDPAGDTDGNGPGPNDTSYELLRPNGRAWVCEKK